MGSASRGDAPVRAAKEPPSHAAVLALKAYRQIERDKAKGVKLEDLKLPGAKETLDLMVDDLKKLRATHAPPPREYKSPYYDKLPPPPADLEERIGNREHPTFKKELAFIDLMIARGERLQRDGVPYRDFVNFSLLGFNRAMSLAMDPREHRGPGSFMQRELSLDPDHLPEAYGSLEQQYLHSGRITWFPTHESLTIQDFNRLVPYGVRFLGVVDKPTWGDDAWWSAERFPIHDQAHGSGLDTGNVERARGVRNRYFGAVAKVKDPEVRNLLQLNFFGNTHEEGVFDYDKLDAATRKYAPEKFAAAASWLDKYREKEFAPRIKAISGAYDELRAQQKDEVVTALLDQAWRTITGGRISHTSYAGFRKDLGKLKDYRNFEEAFEYKADAEGAFNACKYSSGCLTKVLNALDTLNKQVGEMDRRQYTIEKSSRLD
jgi:hypothetical protein